MILRKIPVAFVLCCVVCLAVMSCGGGGGKSYPRFSSDDTEIVNFTFPASKNSTLPSDVYCDIDGDSITAEVPHDTDVTSLVAEFVTNNSDVTVNDVVQQSGISTCDYTSSVQFVVTSEIGSTRVYTVALTRAPGTDKRFSTFLINGITGSIDEEAGTIKVELPAHTLVTNLVPSFEALCAGVSIGDVVQVSGETENDFTAPVTYTVKAEDNSTRDYTVTVEVLKDTAKDLTGFVFTRDCNPSLPGDYVADISSGTFSVELPYGSSTSGLIATFTTTGDHVLVNDVLQTSGETACDFDSPVDYVVVAEDGTTDAFTVSVTVAKNDAKAITGFTIDGVDGDIDDDTGTITLSLPQLTDISALRAEFITTGVSVAVNDVVQETGVTANDFSSDVLYIVTADNGTTRTYTVKVIASSEVIGVWNFEDTEAEGYTVSGATTVDGLEGSALYFDNIDYLLIPDSDALTLATAGTLEATIKVSSNQFCAGIIHKGVMKDFSDEAYSLQYWSGNVVRIMITNDAGTSIYAQGSTALVADTWYHLVATWDADYLKLYIDGVCEATTANTVGSVRDTDGGLVIGAQLADEQYNSTYNNLGFNGIIDSVRILGRAMTSDEVQERYSSLPIASGSAITAYLISAVSRHTFAVGLIFMVVALSLLVLYAINRRRARGTM